MLENHFYHIYNRGNNKENLFLEEKNYIYFLNKFNYYLKDKITIYSYCLMPNHFHFLIKINELNEEVLEGKMSKLEKAFKDFFISYAKAINKSYNRTGSLFQYKFKRKLVDDQSYLTRLIAYIHLNPVRAGIVSGITDWKYSSYSAFMLNSAEDYLKIERKEVLVWYGDLQNFIKFHNNYNDFEKERKFLFE